MGTDRAGGDSTPRAGEGGAYRKTPTQLATDPAFTGTYVQRAGGTSAAAAPLPFFNVKDFGAVGDGATDDVSAVRAAISAAVSVIQSTGRGATVYLPPGVYYFNSKTPSPPANESDPGNTYSNAIGIGLPCNLPGILTVQGAGRGATTVKLSANAHNVFWIKKVADYDWFQNVTIQDFDVDNNNAVGRCHILIGNVPEYITPQPYINVNNVIVRRMGCKNVPQDATQNATYKAFVQFWPTHKAANEATRTYCTNITCEDLEILDAQSGVLINSSVNRITNCWYDNIFIRRCRHVVPSVPAATLQQTSYYVCGSGVGEYFEIIDCHSENIGDDGIELGSMQRGRIINFRAVNPYLVGILFRHTQAPPDVTQQHITIQNYVCEVDSRLEAAATAASVTIPATPFAWQRDDATLDFGTFTFDRCQSRISGINIGALSRIGNNKGLGWFVNSSARRVELLNCSVIVSNCTWTSSFTQDVTMVYASQFASSQASGGSVNGSRSKVIIRNHEVSFENFAVNSAVSMAWHGLWCAGQGEIDVDGFECNVDNVTYINGAGGSFSVAEIGRAGTLHRVRLAGLRGIRTRASAGATGVQVQIVSAATLGAGLIERCDFRMWTGSLDDVRRPTGANAISQVTMERENLYANIPNGGRRNPQAANYTMTCSDRVVAVTSTVAARTITLPPIALAPIGDIYTVKDESGAASTNNVTVAAAGTDLIEGAASKVISTNYGVVKVYSNGTAWLTA